VQGFDSRLELSPAYALPPWSDASCTAAVFWWDFLSSEQCEAVRALTLSDFTSDSTAGPLSLSCQAWQSSADGADCTPFPKMKCYSKTPRTEQSCIPAFQTASTGAGPRHTDPEPFPQSFPHGSQWVPSCVESIRPSPNKS